MKMKGTFKRFVQKHGSHICSLAILFGLTTQMGCRWIYYQPKEPDGLEEFLKKRK